MSLSLGHRREASLEAAVQEPQEQCVLPGSPFHPGVQGPSPCCWGCRRHHGASIHLSVVLGSSCSPAPHTPSVKRRKPRASSGSRREQRGSGSGFPPGLAPRGRAGTSRGLRPGPAGHPLRSLPAGWGLPGILSCLLAMKRGVSSLHIPVHSGVSTSPVIPLFLFKFD